MNIDNNKALRAITADLIVVTSKQNQSDKTIKTCLLIR